MRIVVMGTGPFAVPTFRWLHDSDHEVVALVTRPVPPARGKRPAPANPMREAAQAMGLPILEPPSVNDTDFLPQLAALRGDLLVVCDYGQILSRDTLAMTPLGGINLHASLLPRYRGAAPINWALYHGETETGVSVIHMSPRLDAGPCLVQRSVSIGAAEDAVELEHRLAELGVDAVQTSIALLDEWDRHAPIGQPQDESLASRAPRLKKRDGRIDWLRNPSQVLNQLRAFRPWPNSFTHWPRPDKEPLQLLVEKAAEVHDTLPPATADTQPGCVLSSRERGELWVRAGEGVLAISQLRPAGKRSMSSAEFLRGYPVPAGTRFE